MTEVAIGILPATIAALTSSISALSDRGTRALIVPRPTPPFSEGEAGRATGLERPARELSDRVEHGHVQPLHRARQDVLTEVGLVDIDSDPPDPTLACRLQRPEAAVPGDLEDDSRSLRDLAQGDRPPFTGSRKSSVKLFNVVTRGLAPRAPVW